MELQWIYFTCFLKIRSGELYLAALKNILLKLSDSPNESHLVIPNIWAFHLFLPSKLMNFLLPLILGILCSTNDMIIRKSVIPYEPYVNPDNPVPYGSYSAKIACLRNMSNPCLVIKPNKTRS